jgi:hypothetical protein
MLGGGHGQRLGSGIDVEPGLALRDAGSDDRQADAVAGNRSAVRNARAIIAARDTQPMQLALRRRFVAFDLADIGDDAGKH